MKQLSSLLKISVSVLLLFLQMTASGGVPYGISAGAGEAGMGYACVMKKGFWSTFHNQALLAYNNSLEAGFNYENRFSIQELGTRTIGLIIPAGKSSAGAAYSNFGYRDFRRDLAVLSCGLKLGDNLAAGVQVNYFSERCSGEYDNYQFITFETGLVITPSENILIGVHLFNPVPNSIRKKNQVTTLSVGAGTELNDVLFAGVETEMSSGGRIILRTGVEYAVMKKLWLRTGFSTSGTSFSFGMGYRTGLLTIDIGCSTHEELGITSSASLIFRIR